MKNDEIAMQECERALKENSEYMELQRRCAATYKEGDYARYSDLVCDLQAMAELICYNRGEVNRCTQICTRNIKTLGNV